MKPIILAVILAALYLIASGGAYDDAQAQNAHQCAMIAAGHWPESVNPNCKE